jgi:hypothetical protein
LLSAVSHTPLMQTRAPFAGVQVPPIGAAGGSGSPFALLGVHTPAWHQSAGGQSASTAHVVPQAPVVVSQMVPACPVAQSEFDEHLTQVPLAEQ